MITAAMI
jgi:uncharacterized membrane protein YtjA (UPF0391 family)